jgi:hypothetical protein
VNVGGYLGSSPCVAVADRAAPSKPFQKTEVPAAGLLGLKEARTT